MPCCFYLGSKRIQRYLHVGNTIRFCGRQITGADIDLHCGKNQHRHFQRRVSLGTHVDKRRLADTVMHMNVFSALFADRGFKRHGAIRRWVVVAHEQPGFIRQAEDLLG